MPFRTSQNRVFETTGHQQQVHQQNSFQSHRHKFSDSLRQPLMCGICLVINLLLRDQRPHQVADYSSSTWLRLSRGQVQRVHRHSTSREVKYNKCINTVHRERSSTTSASTQNIETGQVQQVHRHRTSREVKYNNDIDRGQVDQVHRDDSRTISRGGIRQQHR